MHREIWPTGGHWSGAILSIAVLVLPACNKPEPRAKAKQEVAQEKPGRNACADQAAYEGLKAAAFEKAKEVHSGDPATLDRLASTASVRMDDPATEGRDEALNVTICKGRMTVDLPPGFQDAFSGDPRLSADVKYAVQATTDRGLRTYALQGAEPIIYRLAAIDLKSGLPVAQSSPAPQRTVLAASSTSRTERRAEASRRSAGPEPRLTARGRPSFNCRHVRSRTDRMVCGDERLAALDRVAASLFDQALDDSDRETRAILRGTQGRFLARRERCASPGCIAAAYRDRMDEIDRIASRG